MKKTEQYAAQHRERHLEELKELLRIPSISTLSEHKGDVARCAQWLSEALTDSGLEHAEVMQTAGHPIVYADWLHAPGKPTLLIYGHYDVQPADPLDLWDSAPFEPEIRDGKIYARGATDDKAQFWIHVKAAETMLKTAGTLPLNLKFILEGEEEITSPSLAPFIQQHADKLKADAVIISDTPMLEKGKPALIYGLRGVAGVEISVQAAKNDLHSGLYGGGVPNAVHALVSLLDSFHDEKGQVTVEGFYDRIVTLTEKEREELGRVAQNEEKIRKDLELSELYGEEGYTFTERTTARPTLEITGITGGFAGEGIKPIVPAQAKAKIACRLVADQRPEEIMKLIEKHVAAHTPPGVKATVARILQGNPFLTPSDHPIMVAASHALKLAYGEQTALTRGGGSIPIVDVFERLLKTPVVMMGFGLPDENLHAPNEHFDLDNFDKGLQTVTLFWDELAASETL
ncbi:dipeptidase [Paenibacillus lutrae]|uniref:Dipeptidase n=1 Tax=Paenibacillus lutrae TaxID=2078573 RepID=A0A7X3JYV0_9BACL|nr:dipeptidase [Paenibacillus lutrae]MVO99334.1 dipeptidase [Paenibacillus lutrae]